MRPTRALHRLSAAVVALAICSGAISTSRGLDFVAQNVPPTPGSSSQWSLEAALPMSGSVFAWPINVFDDVRCRRLLDVTATLVGTRLPRLDGASARLLHRGNSATLLAGSGTGDRIGTAPLQAASQAAGILTFAARQSPHVLHFTEPLPGQNLALGRPATGSVVTRTDILVGDASRAVDGVKDGYLSNHGLFVSTVQVPGGAEPWLQIDLASSGPVATVGQVHVYDRSIDGDGRMVGESAVHEVKVTAIEALPTGSFQLTLVLNGVEYTTDDIPLNAPATKADALAANVAVSMEAALEALAPVGRVLVERTTNGFAGYGTYTWKITYVERAGLPLIQYTSGSLKLNSNVPINSIQVATRLVRHGRGNMVYTDSGKAVSIYEQCTEQAYTSLSAEDRCRDVACGSGVSPSWLILSTAAIGGMPVDQARVHPSVVFAQQLPCPAQGRRHIIVPLTTPVSARYLRIQRPSGDGRVLQVAEVEVYSAQHNGVSQWRGGAEVPPGTYNPEESLRAAFVGAPVSGSWVMEFTLPPAPPADTRRPRGDQSDLANTSPAMMSSWQLHLTCDGSRPDWNDNEDTQDEVTIGAVDPNPSTGYDPLASPVTRTFEAGVTVTVHTWPKHGRIAPVTRTAASYEGTMAAAPVLWRGAASDPSLGQLPYNFTGNSTVAKESPFEQCVDGAALRKNLDGSQTACEKGQYAPKQPIPVTATDASDLPVGSTDLRLLELDWARHGYCVAYDPFLGWGKRKSLASTLLPLAGESSANGQETGSEGTDEIIYSARASHQTVAVVHRLRLQAARP